MSLPNYFASLARYHAWATQRLVASNLQGLSDDEWHRDCGLFFRSVHRTVNHLLLTDNIWFCASPKARPCLGLYLTPRSLLHYSNLFLHPPVFTTLNSPSKARSHASSSTWPEPRNAFTTTP